MTITQKLQAGERDDETCTSCRGTGYDPVMETRCCCDPMDDDDLAEAEMNCGMGPDGFCTLAGTEQCDFECPFS